ncbi:MAG: acetyl-CoA carboxylase biotin carboxylase subunit [Myxococcota bacterium]
MPFDTVLVANRGEIAVRVITAARSLGYRTVAIYSDADSDALHVAFADAAVRIGPPPAAESYLRIDAVLAAAKATGAGAIHPGYGFLSENAEFAAACEEAGIVFIGPPAEAIRAMGDKANAKARMAAAGVPVVPGSPGPLPNDLDEAGLIDAAREVGFPLLVKATAGGGGRGMRLVRSAEELAEAVASAQREAASAFGDSTVLFEAFVEHARHVEVQVFADNHGNVVHLGERDCSTQRRRQKVIEEAPSPAVDADLRARMGADAVRAAEAIGYRGAGTVEMILGRDGRYFFLEMNTRLQVEHPVTEMVTGQDLVVWQLEVAAGKPLPLSQAEIALTGHAIEARLYAEDPTQGFQPQTGPVRHFRPDRPTAWPGVRIDAGVREGDVVTPFYDPMIAKVMAYGRDREEARRRLHRALQDLPVVGLTTNQPFLVGLLADASFIEASITTGTLDQWLSDEHPLLQPVALTDGDWAMAAAWVANAADDWFRSAHGMTVDVSLQVGEEVRALRVEGQGPGVVVVEGGEVAYEVTLMDLPGDTDDDEVRRRVGLRFNDDLPAVNRPVTGWAVDGGWLLDFGRGPVAFFEPSPYPDAGRDDDPSEVRTPVAGTLVRIDAAVGDAVDEGQVLAVVEAMKMETRLTARASGTVTAVHGTIGQQVRDGDVIIALEPQGE